MSSFTLTLLLLLSPPLSLSLSLSSRAFFPSHLHKSLVLATFTPWGSASKNATRLGISLSSSSCSIECTFIFTKTDFSSCCQRRSAVQTFIMFSLIFFPFTLFARRHWTFSLSHGQCIRLKAKRRNLSKKHTDAHTKSGFLSAEHRR